MDERGKERKGGGERVGRERIWERVWRREVVGERGEESGGERVIGRERMKERWCGRYASPFQVWMRYLLYLFDIIIYSFYRYLWDTVVWWGLGGLGGFGGNKINCKYNYQKAPHQNLVL